MHIVNVRRIGFLAFALVLATTPVAFGADPPKGSHGQEIEAPVASSAAEYSHAVALASGGLSPQAT
jgi:hypothetical protein